MGDRSNIVVQQSNGDRVFLYGHWMGEDSINIVHNVLARGERLTDTPYLTRIIFCEMVKGDADGDTGYGISTTMCDNDGYPLIVIDPSEQMVWLEEHVWSDNSYRELTPKSRFDMFVNASSVCNTFPDLAVAMGSKLVTS